MHPDFDEDILYYTWQFLRLNTEYQEMYDKYAILLKNDEAAADQFLFELYKRWGLRSYPDWRDENPDILPEIFFDKITNFGVFSFNSLFREDVIGENSLTLRRDKPSKEKYLLVAFDLEQLRPTDYEKFKKEVFRIQSENELKVKSLIKRDRLDKKRLDTILATYKFSLSHPTAKPYDIVKNLPKYYKITSSRKPGSHFQTVKNNLKIARDLVQLAPDIDLDFKKKRRSK